MTTSSHHPSAQPSLLFVGAALASSDFAERLRRTLSSGFFGQSAASLEDAVRHLRQRTWSLVICECAGISASNALETLRLIKQLQPHAPVLFVSSGALTAHAVTALMRAGAAGVVEASDLPYLVELIIEELRAPQPTAPKPRSTSLLPSAEHDVNVELAEVLDSMQDALMCFSLPDHRVIFASGSVEDVFGYPLARFLDDRSFYRQIVHPDDFELAHTAMQRGLRDGFTEVDHRVVRSDGSIRWLHRRMWLNYNAHGQPIRINDNARDITERKLAETAMRASEEKYRSLIESSDSAIALYDAQGTVLYANQIAASSLQLTPETIVGRRMHDLFPLPVADAQLSGIQQVINTGVGYVSERPSQVSGEMRWFRTSVQPVRDANGLTTAAIINASDITQIKNSEEALRQSEAYLRSLVNSATAYNLRVDVQGNINYCNERFRQQFAWIAPTLIGLSPLVMVHSIDHETVMRAVRESLHITGKPVQLEIRMRTPDDSALWTLWEFSAVPGLNSHFQEINCVGFDISRQKQAEAALQEANQQLEARVAERTAQLQHTTDRIAAIIDHSGDSIVLINIDHGIQQANHAFDTLLGLTEADYLDRQLSAFFQTGTGGELDAILRAAADNHETLRIETQVNPAHNQPRLVEISIAPVNRSTAAVQNLVCIIRDITERKHAEESMRQTLAREKELGELKSRFVSMASHEFRTPLASILATTETLMLYRDRLDADKINERLKRIRTQVAHMTGIVDDVLQLSRIQTGRVKFVPQPGDLCHLCVNIITEFASQPEYHGRLVYACTEPSIRTQFDERLLRQAISNLVHNALKYSPNGRPVRLRLDRIVDYVTLCVTDEGIGIPEEDQARLFDPFHRAGNVGSISGTGLGLSIAKEAIELHNGSIALESEINVGTTFTVTLPIIK